MKPQRITGYKIEEKYLICGGKMYRLEKLTDDESLAEMFNDGDALPLMHSDTMGGIDYDDTTTNS